ncbi:MAG: TAT-variant-translocated molybdopterin oxidoreductase, partial [Anaerolineales bacterium]
MDPKNPPEQNHSDSIDLVSIAKQITEGEKKTSWRSLQELADSDDFEEHLRKEFPRQGQALDLLNRRDFLKLLAASLSLAGLSACAPQSANKIVPYVNAPPEITSGEDLYYATAMEIDGFARGLLVKSTMGRPIKAEGNPEHPASLGATDPFGQAALLSLYDPYRAKVVRNQGRISTWEAFQSVLLKTSNDLASKSGSGLRVLSGPVTSPTLASQMTVLLEKFPQARWHQYAPVSRDNIYQGTQMAFGEKLNPVYRFDVANVILSIDSDFTLREPGALRYAHDFMQKRRVVTGATEMNRLYAIETSLTNTGALADHRIKSYPAQVEAFVSALAQQLGVSGANGQSHFPAEWMSALVDDLQANAGKCLVIVGEQQPPLIHALGFAINEILGNIGRSVYFTEHPEAEPKNGGNLVDLVGDLNNGQVDVLLVLEQNPVYDAPADLDFSSAYQKADLSIYLGAYADETAELSNWHIPAAHFLESWGDTRAYDGTVSIVQPLIEPLYNGKTAYELLSVMLGNPQTSNYDIVHDFWQERKNFGISSVTGTPTASPGSETSTPTTEAPPSGVPLRGTDFQTMWESSLKSGFVDGTVLPSVDVSLALNLESTNQPSVDPSQPYLVFEPDPTIWDGRWANNGWLQELPKRLTKLTWDNAAIISPTLATQMGLNDEDMVQLQVGERSVMAPIYILPGQPEKAVTIHLGYGRQQGGEVLKDHGFNAYQLRTSDDSWFGYGLSIQKTGKKYSLATTQHHQSMAGRDLARSGNFQDYLQNQEMFQNPTGEQPSLYPPFEYNLNKWGMSINLNACIGCNACVIACQAENNIPVVGKEQVLAGREMHWLRIDRYFEGNDLNKPDVLFQPVPCMQCEDAPCEPVCPVEATQHDEEGINEMVYNRCIGTRFCSNNCPYKVRRFNFLQFSDLETNSLKMLNNPDVTV